MTTRDDRVIVRTPFGYERDTITKRDREKFKTARHDWFTWDRQPHNPPKNPNRLGAAWAAMYAVRPSDEEWDHATQQADELEERLAQSMRNARSVYPGLRRLP